MESSSDNERLNFVLNGPWAHNTDKADLFLEAQRTANISLRGSVAGVGNTSVRIRSAELSNMFRGHWVVPIKENEQAVRNSFGEALDVLQLLELGIESSYYRIEDVKGLIVDRLNHLFWSQAAVDYIKQYNRLLVRYVACRSEFDLGLPLLAPPIEDEAEIAYAGFLLTFAQMRDDDEMQEAIKFVYTSLTNSTWSLSESSPVSNDTMAYCSLECTKGFYKIISCLDDIFESVSEKRRKYFALIFSDWLSIFSGYTLSKEGYVKLPTSLSDFISNNAHVIMESVGYQEADKQVIDETAALLKGRIDKIKSVWSEAQNEIQSFSNNF